MPPLHIVGQRYTRSITLVGFGQALLDVAAREDARRPFVVAVREELGAPGFIASSGSSDEGQDLVLHVDQPERRLGGLHVDGGERGDRFAREADAIVEDVLPMPQTITFGASL